MGRILERGCRRLGVAALPVEACIVGDVVKHGGSARANRVKHPDDSRQDFIFDLDRISRFARLFNRVGDDECHRVADASHLVDRHRRARRLFHRRTVGVADAPGAGQAADLVRGKISAGVDCRDAGEGGGGRDVDALDQRVRMW
jgi:hypothetical protein